MRQEEEILRGRVNSEHRTYENRWVGGDQHGEMGTQEGSRGRKKNPQNTCRNPTGEPILYANFEKLIQGLEGSLRNEGHLLLQRTQVRILAPRAGSSQPQAACYYSFRRSASLF